MDDLHKKVLRKFHTLCGVCGMTDDEKRAVIASYGVESSSDIDTHALIDLCASLARRAGQTDMDRLRKRLLAAVSGYLAAMDHAHDLDTAKRVACRAAGCDTFNRIPADRLRSLYNAFTKRRRDLDAVTDLAREIYGA